MQLKQVQIEIDFKDRTVRLCVDLFLCPAEPDIGIMYKYVEDWEIVNDSILYNELVNEYGKEYVDLKINDAIEHISLED